MFRVNANLDKIKWTPSINSFVKIQPYSNVREYLNTQISIVDSNKNVVDLTSEISISDKELKGDGDNDSNKSSTNNNSNNGIQVIAG